MVFKRNTIIKAATGIQLHGFCDASEKAYGASIYLRTTDGKGHTQVSLLIAKSKVVPLKRQTISRLELCGAVLLATLATTVRRMLGVDIKMCCGQTAPSYYTGSIDLHIRFKHSSQTASQRFNVSLMVPNGDTSGPRKTQPTSFHGVSLRQSFYAPPTGKTALIGSPSRKPNGRLGRQHLLTTFQNKGQQLVW